MQAILLDLVRSGNILFRQKRLMDYIKQFIPELRNLNGKFLYSPWEAPENVLQSAGIELGKNYPEPIVDLKLSREKALAAFEKLK